MARDFDLDAQGVVTSGPFKGSHTRPPSVHNGDREIVWHRPVPPTVEDAKGPGSSDEVRESHPAYGVINFSRMTTTPGAVLFDSDIRHGEYIRLTVQRATRQRGLGHDWIHADGRDLIEVDMSMAQFAGVISSFGQGGGVPVTIRSTESNVNVDGLEFAPRMTESLDEVRSAAATAFGRIKEAQAALDALPKDAKAAERKAAQGRLRTAIEHAEGNVEFATSNLTKHTENVVQKAKADIEAMVNRHAQQIGLSAAQTPSVAALEG